MEEGREKRVWGAINYCIQYFSTEEATNRIVNFWKDELELQDKASRSVFLVQEQNTLVNHGLFDCEKKAIRYVGSTDNLFIQEIQIA